MAQYILCMDIGLAEWSPLPEKAPACQNQQYWARWINHLVQYKADSFDYINRKCAGMHACTHAHIQHVFPASVTVYTNCHPRLLSTNGMESTELGDDTSKILEQISIKEMEQNPNLAANKGQW